MQEWRRQRERVVRTMLLMYSPISSSSSSPWRKICFRPVSSSFPTTVPSTGPGANAAVSVAGAAMCALCSRLSLPPRAPGKEAPLPLGCTSRVATEPRTPRPPPALQPRVVLELRLPAGLAGVHDPDIMMVRPARQRASPSPSVSHSTTCSRLLVQCRGDRR